MADVEVRVPALCGQIVVVLRKDSGGIRTRSKKYGSSIDRMGKSIRSQERKPVAEALVQLRLETVVIRTHGILGLEQLSKTKKRRSHNAWHGSPELVVIQELRNRGRNPNKFHTRNHGGCQRIDKLLGDVCLIDLHEPWQLGASRAHVGNVQQHAPGQLMLNAEVEVLRVRCPQMLLRDRQHRKSGGAEGVWPACEWKRSEEIRQKRRVEHHVARDVSDNGFVEQSIACAHHRFSFAEYVPGNSDAGSKVMVSAVVDAAHLSLCNYSGGFEGRQVVLNIRVSGI